MGAAVVTLDHKRNRCDHLEEVFGEVQSKFERTCAPICFTTPATKKQRVNVHQKKPRYFWRRKRLRQPPGMRVVSFMWISLRLNIDYSRKDRIWRRKINKYLTPSSKWLFPVSKPDEMSDRKEIWFEWRGHHRNKRLFWGSRQNQLFGRNYNFFGGKAKPFTKL